MQATEAHALVRMHMPQAYLNQVSDLEAREVVNGEHAANGGGGPPHSTGARLSAQWRTTSQCPSRLTLAFQVSCL